MMSEEISYHPPPQLICRGCKYYESREIQYLYKDGQEEKKQDNDYKDSQIPKISHL